MANWFQIFTDLMETSEQTEEDHQASILSWKYDKCIAEWGEGGREGREHGKNISFRLVKSNSKGEIQTKYSVLWCAVNLGI